MAVIALPSSLARTIAAEVERLPISDLIEAAQSLSIAYRRQGCAIPLTLTDALRAAYLTVRLPATYAAVSAALAELSRGLGDVVLRTCLDVGSGPGTASLAAHNLWPSLSVHQ